MTRRMLWLLAVGLLLNISAVRAEERFDIVIRGGRVVDGSGAPWFVADVGIRNGRIVTIGNIPEDSAAQRTIDAAGLYVAPGFIDMMGQSATPILKDSAAAKNLLTQGITTINAGEGSSAAPVSEEDSLSLGWRTMSEYFTLLELRGLPLNVAQTVGHSQIRRLVLKDVDRRPTAEELEVMKQYVEEAMQAGAIGVSTALIYPPATYASMEEIAALCSVAGRYGGRYFTHMRNEGDRLLDAIDEALEIGRLGQVPVHIFHLKTAGRQNWGKMELALARIAEARRSGEQVTADIYPYVHNGLGLTAFVHPRHFAEGRARFFANLKQESLRKTIREEMETTDGWENWFRHVGHDWNKVVIGQTTDREFRQFTGQTVQQLAEHAGKDPWDVFFQLLTSNTFALPESMSEANKIKAMQQEFVTFCTDVGPAEGQQSASHPRASGSFPRLLSRYVREWGAISLEQAVARASAHAANEILAHDRGRIAIGQAADVIVFDFDRLQEQATFAKPDAVSTGMQFVLVNGQVVLEDGEVTARRPGRVLRGPGYDPQTAPSQILTGDCDPRLAVFDTAVQRFMERHSAVGASLAVTWQGRLVLARGYGYADVAAHEPVQPESLFRLASVSKPITAVAILQLVEQGKLKLDDPVLSILDIEPFLESGATFDERWRSVTIRHLLNHSGGWDRGKSFDAMFMAVPFAKSLGVDAPAGAEDVIRVMLGKPFDFDPGTQYAYSNLGYNILGRVIEKLTGQPYEEYVQQHVFAPLGPIQARLGRTHLMDRAPGEVRYYHPLTAGSVFQADLGEQVPSQYGGWHLEAMDAHGAWIASAVDLARFCSAFDDAENSPVLQKSSIDAMYGRPEGITYGSRQDSYYYSLGWSNNEDQDGIAIHAHGGALPGTATTILRKDNGCNMVLLLNARVTPLGGTVNRDIEPLLLNAARQVQEWPEFDLFESYPAKSSDK